MKAIVTTRLNLRKSPNLKSEVLEILEQGIELEITSTKNGWSRVKNKGYVMDEFLKRQDVSMNDN